MNAVSTECFTRDLCTHHITALVSRSVFIAVGKCDTNVYSNVH